MVKRALVTSDFFKKKNGLDGTSRTLLSLLFNPPSPSPAATCVVLNVRSFSTHRRCSESLHFGAQSEEEETKNPQ